MGKVIALKLNKKEERIIKKLNAAGITNSELIREALWHYFNTAGNFSSYGINHEIKSENKEEDFYEISDLKKEVDELKLENSKLRQELKEEINRLNSQFEEKLPELKPIKEELSPRDKYAFDIRKNIDNLLRNKQ